MLPTIFNKFLLDIFWQTSFNPSAIRKRTKLIRVIHICVLIAFKLFPGNFLIFKFCLIHLKKSSICHLCLNNYAISLSDILKSFVTNICPKKIHNKLETGVNFFWVVFWEADWEQRLNGLQRAKFRTDGVKRVRKANAKLTATKWNQQQQWA